MLGSYVHIWQRCFNVYVYVWKAKRAPTPQGGVVARAGGVGVGAHRRLGCGGGSLPLPRQRDTLRRPCTHGSTRIRRDVTHTRDAAARPWLAVTSRARIDRAALRSYGGKREGTGRLGSARLGRYLGLACSFGGHPRKSVAPA
ncbi:Hypothetical protein NTJ_07439 [Nesidiocoris tenuis]|uniref:Uncharacterized protein n=1 Tax=Nesidiocoris tenuis TaxID=355587 RepID=A0ABN7AQY5_9HEMI|nr:Hypothetical protein NTJ_07439 [Nesidiocoris tenuis]